MHPGIIVAKLTASDQQELVTNPETGDVGIEDEDAGMSLPVEEGHAYDTVTNPETGNMGYEDTDQGVSESLAPVDEE